ncbi:hypothetical protein PAV19gp26 [Psittacine adenovirus 3]|uniref:Uncharacterized protein n=1 Tax=Psittacine adenovirus 3 TaxID=1580497 RepID=A0A5C0PX92_9ADEN|nr:hypothetical protein PAV19gp26 [Psittacine adenovirus 3]
MKHKPRRATQTTTIAPISSAPRPPAREPESVQIMMSDKSTTETDPFSPGREGGDGSALCESVPQTVGVGELSPDPPDASSSSKTPSPPLRKHSRRNKRTTILPHCNLQSARHLIIALRTALAAAEDSTAFAAEEPGAWRWGVARAAPESAAAG